MAALWNRAGHYIFVLWFLLLFFSRLFSAVADWMSAILLHILSAIGKYLSNSNISCTCRHISMMNVGPLTTEIDLGVWGTPANFNGFYVLASLLHRRRSTEVNQTLHDVWPSPGLLCIFGGSCPPNGILSVAKFTLRPCLAFSCVDSVTARYSSNRRL